MPHRPSDVAYTDVAGGQLNCATLTSCLENETCQSLRGRGRRTVSDVQIIWPSHHLDSALIRIASHKAPLLFCSVSIFFPCLDIVLYCGYLACMYLPRGAMALQLTVESYEVMEEEKKC